MHSFSPVPNDPPTLACSFSGHIYRCCSDSKLRPSRCDPVECSTPGFPVHHHLPESAQTHVHRLPDAVQPSHPLSPFPSCPPSLPASGSFPLNQPFLSGGQSIGASASTTVLPKDIYSGLISFGIAWFISLLPMGLSRVFSAPQCDCIISLRSKSDTHLFVLHSESNGHRLVIS